MNVNLLQSLFIKVIETLVTYRFLCEHRQPQQTVGMHDVYNEHWLIQTLR